MTSSTIQMLLAIALFPTIAVIGAPLCQTESLDAAYESLLKASAVNDVAVGFAGVRTKEYDAFETLWRAGKRAEWYALKLTRSETPASRVYGILLLVEFDRDAADKELPRLQEESTTVLVFNGCIGTTRTVGEIARQVSKGGFVITTPTGKWSREEMVQSPKGLPNELRIVVARSRDKIQG